MYVVRVYQGKVKRTFVFYHLEDAIQHQESFIGDGWTSDPVEYIPDFDLSKYKVAV